MKYIRIFMLFYVIALACINAFAVEVNALTKLSSKLSIVRLIVVLGIITTFFLGLKFSFGILVLSILISLIVVFIFLINYHFKIKDKKQFQETLLQINKDEINFLEKGETPFKNGIEHLVSKHIYAFDLDVFGHKSLFQHLNRTATYLGEKTLANFLLTKKTNNQIVQNQEY